MTKQDNREIKKLKLQETTVTKIYKDNNYTYIHTKVKRKPQTFTFSGSEPISMFKDGVYIDLAPKGNFITRWVLKLWNKKKLENLTKSP